jgi:hypothetical protein
MNEKYLTAKEAAKYVRCSTRQLKRLRRKRLKFQVMGIKGGPAFVQRGRSILYEICDLDDWMKMLKKALETQN